MGFCVTNPCKLITSNQSCKIFPFNRSDRQTILQHRTHLLQKNTSKLKWLTIRASANFYAEVLCKFIIVLCIIQCRKWTCCATAIFLLVLCTLKFTRLQVGSTRGTCIMWKRVRECPLWDARKVILCNESLQTHTFKSPMQHFPVNRSDRQTIPGEPHTPTPKKRRKRKLGGQSSPKVLHRCYDPSTPDPILVISPP